MKDGYKLFTKRYSPYPGETLIHLGFGLRGHRHIEDHTEREIADLIEKRNRDMLFCGAGGMGFLPCFSSKDQLRLLELQKIKTKREQNKLLEKELEQMVKSLNDPIQKYELKVDQSVNNSVKVHGDVTGNINTGDNSGQMLTGDKNKINHNKSILKTIGKFFSKCWKWLVSLFD